MTLYQPHINLVEVILNTKEREKQEMATKEERETRRQNRWTEH
jgi:hypothetical protein